MNKKYYDFHSLSIFWRSFFVFLLAALIVSGFLVPGQSAHAVISTLTVISPNGGEFFSGVEEITWTFTGGEPGDTVNIVFSIDDFSSQAVIATDVAFDSSPFLWDTTTFSDDTNYKVRFIDDSLFVYHTSEAAFTVDNTPPNVNAGEDKITNVEISQDAEVLDPLPSSGIDTYLWEKVSGPGVITFGTPTLEDTTISADTDGTYVIRLTVTDNAGNSTFDDMQLIWDATPPTVALTYDPTSPVKAGAVIITATYSEPVTSTPQISIDQQGSEDITNVAMTNSGDDMVWTYEYTVNPDDGLDYIDGLATVSLSSVADEAGNPAEAPTGDTFIIDTINPEITDFFAPVEDTVYKTAPPLQFTPNDTGTAVSCSYTIDGGESVDVPCSNGVPVDETIPGLTDGRRELIVSVTDAAENSVSESPVSFVFDDDNTLDVPRDFDTIQEAINKAEAGDTVDVTAGTYDEDVVINKSLTLQSVTQHGANIQGTVKIQSNDVILDGFKITHFSQIPTPDWSGVYILGSNSVVSNNLIDGDSIDPVANLVVGIHTLYGGTASGEILNNQIKNVRMGIYIQAFNGELFEVIGNTIEQTTWSAIGIDSDAGVVVNDNTINDCVVGMEIFRGNVDVTENTFTGGTTGIYVFNVTDVVVNDNRIIGYSDYGVDNLDSETVDAEKNWWGTAVRSTIEGMVNGDVDFDPYYVNEEMTILSNVPVYTVYIDDDYIDGSADGHYFGYDAFAIIQEGVDAVEEDGTVNVAAGTYNEDITINKTLTLNGAQVGIDARDRSASESEIIGSIKVTSGVSNITIDGFKVTSTSSGPLQGVCMRIESEDSTIQNNKIVLVEPTGHTYSGVVDFEGITSTTVEYNDFSGGLDPVSEPNVIRLGITGAGIVTIANNEMRDVGGGGGIGIMSSNADAMINIENNEINNTGDGIWVWSPSTQFNTLSITSNSIYNNAKKGVKVVGSVTGIILVNNNSLYNNTEDAVFNEVIGLIVNAEKNWWGQFSGPTHPSNPDDPDERGDAVSDLVDFSPWCTEVPVEGACELGSNGPLLEFLLEFAPLGPISIPDFSELTVTAVDAGGVTLVNDTRQVELNGGGTTRFDDVFGPALINLVDGVLATNVTEITPGTVNVVAKDSGVPFGSATITFSGDETAPTLDSHTPEDDAIDVSVNVIPRLFFSESLKLSTVSSDNIQLKQFNGDSLVPATVTLAEGGTQIVITPDDNLEYDTQYYFAVSSDVQDEAGNPLSNPIGAGEKADHEFVTMELTGIVLDDIIPPSTGTANDTYLDGWHYIFRITVNNPGETDLSMRFEDWVNTVDEEAIVSVFDNTRLLLNAGAGVGLTEGDIDTGFSLGNDYENQTPGPVDLSEVDLNPDRDGRQVQLDVFVKIPVDTAPGFYETEFGILTEFPD